MKLFQNSVLNKHLKAQDSLAIKAAYKKFSAHFHDAGIQENIRNSKEEQYQGEFLIDLFVTVLGYTKNPATNYNITTEYKNVKDSKKADGAILINGVVKAVIELKGTETTDLNRIETQAFGYKNNQPECVYVITSNFEKLRFYIDNAIENIEFNLFTLTEKEFELLWLCLAFVNIEKNLAKRIKDESVSQEDVITKNLYNDYSLFKRELHQNLVVINPEHDPLTLFKKSQKLLDRFLFLFFAEDRQLLPPNSVRLILDDWRDLQDRDVEIALYSRFKKYFEYLNTGFKGKRYDVFAYNGGLFKTDELLDGLKIDDELLYRHALKLSTYDFASEVDVNILGHIFENSLNELDEIKAQLEGQQVDKSKSKRKKDGVFYTPKYITKYIVDNTVGKLCTEKKAEIGLIEEEYITDRKRTKKTIQPLFNKLTTYRNWLLKLTICDPACGSGAFLNQALDFLINEHRYIDELQAKLFGDAMVLSDFEKNILENNLFGVDLNEESVEIAKLSLWLRTAQPNRKLNDLNNNIKCGNSLIDDPTVAGEKAFNWHNEFPSVFAKGGFDVVIGNPPYVHLEKMKEISEALSKMNYETFDKRGDLYCLFVERGFNILTSSGTISYIMPNKWLQAGYGKPLREYFLNYELHQLIDFGDIQIFDGATTYPCIFVSSKANPKEEFSVSVLSEANKDDFYTNVSRTAETFRTEQFSGETWVISSGHEKKLLERLKRDFLSLFEFIDGDAYYGMKTGLTEAFFIDEFTKDRLISENSNAAEILKPVLRGRDINKWIAGSHDCYLIGTFPALNLDIDAFTSIKNYLLSFGIERLEQSGDKFSRKKTNNKWFETQDTFAYWKVFSKPKIMYQKFQVKPCFIYDETGLYCNDSMWIIPTENKGLLAILNSKMGWWLITKYCTQIQNGCQLIWKYFGQIPVPNTTEDLSFKADLMLTQNKVLHEASQRFQHTIQRKFNLEELPGKLQNWYLLSYAEFIAELAKKKVRLTLKEEAEWEVYFLEEAQQALALKTEIDKTDKEIDRMVYELYGLTEEEIGIVEGV